MTIATYSDLLTAFENWIDRDDLTARFPEFVTIFEAVANRRMRLRQQETLATLTPSSGAATLPTDYLAWRRLTWTGSTPRELEFTHPSYLHALYPLSTQGNPRIFTIEGTTLTVRPSDDTALTFDYFAKIPALVTASTNWLLTAWPDLYLFGSLAEAHGFVKDPESMALWKARRDELFEVADRFDTKTRGPSAIRPMGATP